VTRRLSSVAGILGFGLIFADLSFSRQSRDQASVGVKPAGSAYVSIKPGPGFWHIEDMVHSTNRNSMYLVRGDTAIALIDTGMGSGNLSGYVRARAPLPLGAKYPGSPVLATQKVLDHGEAAFVPSLRTPGIRMAVKGNEDDPAAASINRDPKLLLSGNKK
jgi:hypothetical protein